MAVLAGPRLPRGCCGVAVATIGGESTSGPPPFEKCHEVQAVKRKGNGRRGEMGQKDWSPGKTQQKRGFGGDLSKARRFIGKGGKKGKIREGLTLGGPFSPFKKRGPYYMTNYTNLPWRGS